MGQYDDVLKFLAEREEPSESKMNTRHVLTADAVQELQQRFPGLPKDYMDYLAEIGPGAFRECQYVVYDGFIDPGEIFAAHAVESFGKRILCFGDNFSGDPAGFLPDEDWRVVELWHDSLYLFDPKKSFGEFIRDKMLMGPDGTDLRED
jgi:hypothetical protein